MVHILYVFFSSCPPFIMQPIGANAPSPPWGIQVNIPMPANAEGQSTTGWDCLHFSPLGAYHLRCWQGAFPGVRNFFVTCQSRFRTADIAWFTSGMNRDGKHDHPITSFHPSLVRLVRDTSSYVQGKNERKALLTEVKELMFDVVRFFSDSFHLFKTDQIRQQCMIG
jgi:hypothetical protein